MRKPSNLALFLALWALPVAAAWAQPAISAQPVSQSANLGATVMFSVTATSANPIGYQWQLNGTAIGQATNSSLTLSDVTAAQAGTYTVYVYDSVGGVTSDPATLTLSGGPVITSNLAEMGYAQTIPFYYAITASNSPTSFGATGLPQGLSVDPQTGVISGIPAAVGVYQITIVASNASGSGSATLVLTVNPPPYCFSALSTAPSGAFSDLSGIASGGPDLFYMADTGNNTIYAYKPSTLTATVFAGTTGVAGTSDGTGTAAKFNMPQGLAVDSAGNVYVADTANSTIRKISSAGVVTTLAGAPGEPGAVDGTGSAAHFNYPRSVAVDASGNVYVADSGNYTIRTITPGGVVTTLAGKIGLALISDGTGTGASFGGPDALIIDSKGNLFVEDLTFPANDIREVDTTTGTVTTIFQTGSLGGVNLSGLAIDSSDNLYFVVPEVRSTYMEKLTPSGGNYRLANLLSPNSSSESFEPHAMAFDPSGNIFATFGTVLYKGILAYGPRIVSQPTISVQTLIVVPDREYDTVAFISVMIDTLPKDPLIYSDSSALSYQWFLDGEPISQPSVPGLDPLPPAGSFVTQINPQTVGTYSVLIRSDNGGVVMSNSVTLVLQPAWIFTTQPSSISVNSGASATFSFATSDLGTPTYQWTFNGTAIAGATGSSYTVSAAKVSDSGAYAVIVTDVGGSLTSHSAFLTVEASSGGLTIAGQPQSYTTDSGGTVVLAVDLATSQASIAGVHLAARATSAVSYQWYFNGALMSDGAGISGSLTATLVLSGGGSQAGNYVCLIENSSGSVVSSPSTLTVSPTADIGRLTNVSCRALAGTDSSTLIAGFIVGGSGTSGAEPLLIRGAGPALVPFDVPGTLPDPELQLFSTASGGDLLATNTGWGGSTDVANAAASVGAFAWSSPSSLDSALLETLAPGPYTANISGKAGDSGVALAEVYDTTPDGTFTPSSPRLVNVSARVRVGTGGNILIAGFIVGGSTSATVLIRASGPALAPFGVSGVLPDPQLQLYQSNGDGTSTLLDSNNGWGGSAQIATEAAGVGAFSWGVAPTADSALLVTLPPGIYTAQVSGANSDTGIALVEVYQVP